MVHPHELLGTISLQGFTAAKHRSDLGAFIAALEAFDALPQIQELKALARQRTGIGPGTRLLDVGCGFGLESLRLAELVQPGGSIAGIDKSGEFIAEAQRRADIAGRTIDLRIGDAQALPYPDSFFDVARAERVLVYLPEPARALAEMRRVVRPDGAISLIEPDFGTNAINVPDRALARRILDHECDAGVPQGWLARDLAAMLRDVGFREVEMATRIVVFSPDLAAGYFSQTGRNALQADVIDQAAFERWTAAIADLHHRGRLFGTIGYFLFTARV